MNKPIERIVICGAGLAGAMASAALSRHTSGRVKLTLLQCGDAASDLFYGGLAHSSAYDLNLVIGVAEPRLVLDSDTAFAWGDKYVDWGDARSWVQCFHQPLPVLDGVLFHHYLAQQGEPSLERFLAAAVAARAGAFAHPPERPDHPLSRAEYGYQIDPATYAPLFIAAADPARLERISANVVGVERSEHGVGALRLNDGRTLEADLFIDCTGPGALLLSHLDAPFSGERRVRAAVTRRPAERLGPPVRVITAADYGWRAETHVRGGALRLTVFDPAAESAALIAHGYAPDRIVESTFGRRARAWAGNCLGLGQAAAVLEPLTSAPLLTLQRDLERMLSLLPNGLDMSVERREYNRQHVEDVRNAELFNRALFERPGLPDGAYWRAARQGPLDERLSHKLELFADRGLHVAFDLEPFNQDDWVILHYGMGRRPSRYDRVADRAPAARVRSYLDSMRRELETMVKAMPSHDAYMVKLKSFLMQQKA